MVNKSSVLFFIITKVVKEESVLAQDRIITCHAKTSTDKLQYIVALKEKSLKSIFFILRKCHKNNWHSDNF